MGSRLVDRRLDEVYGIDGIDGRLELLYFKVVGGRFYLNITFRSKRRGNSLHDLTEWEGREPSWFSRNISLYRSGRSCFQQIRINGTFLGIRATSVSQLLEFHRDDSPVWSAEMTVSSSIATSFAATCTTFAWEGGNQEWSTIGCKEVHSVSFNWLWYMNH